jgi:3'-5' exoribonuclease 1
MNIIIFDLEATCWDEDAKMNTATEMEIIEIGAVKVNELFDIVDKFQIFIRPSQHPVLSEFCKRLTSIQQSDVDAAIDFHEALLKFENWAGENPLFMSWGDYDRNQITRECDRKHYKGKMRELVQNHLNIKWKISQHENRNKKMSVSAIMQRLNMQFEGTPHRGIDDAHNIARIAKMYKKILIEPNTEINNSTLVK